MAPNLGTGAETRARGALDPARLKMELDMPSAEYMVVSNRRIIDTGIRFRGCPILIETTAESEFEREELSRGFAARIQNELGGPLLMKKPGTSPG